MDSVTSVSPSMYMYGLPSAAPSTPSAPSTGSLTQPAASVATSVDQATVNMEAQLTSALLGSLGARSVGSTPSLLSSPSLPGTPDPSSLFASGTELSLLNAQGTAAMAYLTPQAPPPGQSLNALA